MIMISVPLTSPHSILLMFLSSYNVEKNPRKRHQLSKTVEDNRYLEGRTKKISTSGI